MPWGSRPFARPGDKVTLDGTVTGDTVHVVRTLRVATDGMGDLTVVSRRVRVPTGEGPPGLSPFPSLPLNKPSTPPDLSRWDPNLVVKRSDPRSLEPFQWIDEVCHPRKRYLVPFIFILGLERRSIPNDRTTCPVTSFRCG